tara:strand:- start:371 stop:571 length:201 start_codon:yes stop_codon:yes gene_type:complete
MKIDLKKYTKELIIGASIIIAVFVFGIVNKDYKSSKDHCYYKVYKNFKAGGQPDHRAAIRARNRCK